MFRAGLGALAPANAAFWTKERLLSAGGALVTIGVVVAVALRVKALSPGAMALRLPLSPAFWLLLLASYLLSPAIDFAILRKLWRLPVSGFPPLVRKYVANELFLGYSGDAQFYLWARAHIGLKAAPFATIRDMSIMSALAGNLATLLLMAATWPALARLSGAGLVHSAVLAVAAVVVTSLGIFAVRHFYFTFSVPRGVLVRIFLAHLARIAASLLLGALLWAALVPITLSTLAMLAAIRMMVSRLPLVPGKEALFAGATMALTGRSDLAVATAAIAVLTLGIHAVVAVAGALHDVSHGGRP